MDENKYTNSIQYFCFYYSLASQVNQNGFVYGTFSDMVTKWHLNGRKQTVSIRNFGHSIAAPYTAPYFHSDTVTVRLFTYINGPYYCARKYGPYRSTWAFIDKDNRKKHVLRCSLHHCLSYKMYYVDFKRQHLVEKERISLCIYNRTRISASRVIFY